MNITPLEAWIARHVGAAGPGRLRERIQAWQLDRLRETVRGAVERSGFYRSLLEGFDARGLASLEDLALLPFTTAQDVQLQPYQFLCVSQNEIERVVTLQTSGTTGDPKRVFFTAEDQERTIDFFHHGMSTLVGPGDRVLILMPGELPGSVGDLLMRGLERLGTVGIPHGPVRDAQRTLEAMERERVSSLVGIPTQVLGLARRSGGMGAPRSVLLSADYVPDAVVQELEQTWGCAVYTHYGMTEMGFGGGVQCEARSGYHLREADLYFEIVEPESGKPVADGELGEVVFTTLTRRGMPLIRYRTGDVSRFIPTPCPCGTGLITLSKVKSRLSSMRRLKDGAWFSMADLDEVVFPVTGVMDFSAVLSLRDGLEHLQLTAHVGGISEAGGAEAIRDALLSHPLLGPVIRAVGLSVDVTITTEPPGITRGAQKRSILDLR